MAEAPPEIRRLIERFKEHREEYLSGAYKEEQVCAEFILPMFEALGWDISNKQGSSEAYKEVIHHDSIRSGVGTEAPDYCFRIGGVRKFFLEAKKPSVNIKDDLHPAYQLRRYAWSAKLPLGILTDFAEFAVYDCRAKPAKTDKASTARILYLTYDRFLDRWDEIAGVFSKDAILKGSFDKYAAAMKGKRGTAGVDDAFLEEIERWRKILAQNVAQRNRKLDVRELNFAVQTIIDRIIFLRICEDQGFESYGQLMALQSGPHAYDRLIEIFRNADRRYNSGLFHFEEEKGRPTPPDTVTPRLKIDDDVLSDIFKNLYYPQSPYEFSVLPTEILGQVYERFLGKVIHLTPTRRAVIEEKPEVRKAGGVYYTPSYIVDYIVKNTVGKLLEGKTPKNASKIRILDPACGSGSFLIGAYQMLLKWHLDWYVNHDPNRWASGKKPALFRDKSGHWSLSIDEQRRILTDNIYGVDIDPQAVEVTKLSLLLKLLEGERQKELFREHALPDLGANIKCGNSLIGTDFYEGKQMSMLGDDERTRINIFDWHQEFAPIMKSGGFDAVIGNPPYIRMEGFKELKAYLQSHYKTHAERADIFFYFVERSSALLRMGGRLGFILSNTFTRSESGVALRRFISRAFRIKSLVEFGDFLPFEGATVYPIITILERTDLKDRGGKVSFVFQDSAPSSAVEGFRTTAEFDEARFGESTWTFEADKTRQLRERLLDGFPPLKVLYGTVNRGIVTGLNEAFIVDDVTRRNILSRNKKAEEIIKPYLGGRNLDQWCVQSDGLHLIYTPHGIDMRPYPGVLTHLEPFKRELLKRATQQEWYELQQPQEAYQRLIESPKIIYPDISRYPKFSLDRLGAYFSNTVYFIPSDSLYLLGLLNSKLLWFIVRGLSNALRGGLWRFRLFSGHMERLPIRKLDLNKESDKTSHDGIIFLVEQQITLHEQLATTKTPQDKTALDRQIAATDRQIDQLVYELYGLTEDEIRIVERS